MITTTDSVIKGVINYIKSQTQEFNYIMEEFYSPEQGFTETLARKLAKKSNQEKDENWIAMMWNRTKPEPMSHRPKIFKVIGPAWFNNLGDLVDQEEAVNDNNEIRPGYSCKSCDYRATWVQSVLELDFIFNSIDWASYFEEIFTLKVYMSKSITVPLPVIGNTVIHLDEIAMGEIDKFDRLQQGTLLSVPVDIVMTYPTIIALTPPKPVITDIKLEHETVNTKGLNNYIK